jgi:hypothetical protein
MGQFKFTSSFLPTPPSADKEILSPSPQTAEHLTLASLGKSPAEDRTPGNGEKGDREKSTFQEDESLPVAFRAKLQDYFRSGYDRGHMYVNKYYYAPLLSSLFCVATRQHLRPLPLLTAKLLPR